MAKTSQLSFVYCIAYSTTKCFNLWETVRVFHQVQFFVKRSSQLLVATRATIDQLPQEQGILNSCNLFTLSWCGNVSASNQYSADVSNARLLEKGNSTSVGHSSHSVGTNHVSGPGPSSSNNYPTTSVGGCEKHGLRRDEEEVDVGQILDTAKVFTLPELRRATKNFRADTFIGEGSFGKVYKGWIKDRTSTNRGHGLTIAVKKWNPQSMFGVQEWQTEVNFLGRLSHPNIIKLLGFGREENELHLVYEFMPRGSLDNHLFGRGANAHALSWDTRLKVMLGVARALTFLHSLEENIIYRDLGTSKILLDETYTAKLSDFGLARSGPTADHNYVSTRVMGTHGYGAPEYITTGHLYVKSDVYGFGIVLIEMLTGKRISDIIRNLCKKKPLIDWLKSNLLNERKMRSTMDGNLESKYPSNLALQLAHLTLNCIQYYPELRPSMKQVVQTLEQIEAANEKPIDNRNPATYCWTLG
ncbi:hypothetical protein VNO77_23892 [Canavalia gladiata]|uniref:Protein kinase domain-containing protein n=1 Tax=Canavalia gladiata TaxID=3824 RepID=A0AAN9QC41_CANGL